MEHWKLIEKIAYVLILPVEMLIALLMLPIDFASELIDRIALALRHRRS